MNVGGGMLNTINKEAAERASQALHKLTGKPVVVEISQAALKPVVEFTKSIGQEELVTGIQLPITGDVHGTSLLIFPRDTALSLCDLLLERPPGTTRNLSELDASALKEVGNIIVGNYLTVLANRLQIRIIEHIPSLSTDMFGAVVDQLTSQLAQRVERAIVLEVHFRLEAVSITGNLILLLAVEALEAIVRAAEER